MSSFIKSLTFNHHAPIAKEAYDFLQSLDSLPDEDEVFGLINPSKTINDLGHKLNYVFTNAIKSALARPVLLKHKKLIKQLINVRYEKHELNSAEDRFTIQFLDHQIKYPCHDKTLNNALYELYFIIEDYANTVLGAGVEKEISYSVVVPQDFIDKLFAIEGLKGVLYQADLKGSANNQLHDNYILNISELRSLAEVNSKYLNTCTELVSVFVSDISTAELPNFYQYEPSYFIFKVKHQG